jgi:translation initiation factor 4E
MEHKLHTPWVLWFHSLDDTNWTKDTYTKVAEIISVEEFLGVYQDFDTFGKGMFFLMRKDIFPQWEDESNIKGGYWSYKIGKTVAEKAWLELSCACIGECLTKKPQDMFNINGISYSPKINNVIIKILNRHSELNNSIILNDKIENLHPSTSQFKSHIENKDEFVST